MRVIAGVAKGRKLVAPKGRRIRPTADRVKESLFSIIADRIKGSAVLDLYAGTGALAIEALSRGAAAATLVDSDETAVAAIHRNLEETGLAERAAVVRAPVTQALDRLTSEARAFDLLFLDPPYKIEAAGLEIVLAKAAGCLRQRGLIVLEHRPDLPEVEVSPGLVMVDRRRYGDTGLSFYKKREN